MKASQIKVARVLLGELKQISQEEREEMEDMLVETKEGGDMNDKDIVKLSIRQLAEKVFVYSFGKTLTKEHNGNSQMAARHFLQAHEENTQMVSKRDAENAARELREAQRRRIFQDGLLLSAPVALQMPDQRDWMLMPGQVEYPFNASVHHSIFQPGLIVHALSQPDNTRYFFRVAETHNGNPSVIIVPERLARVEQVVIFESIQPVSGVDFKALGSESSLTDEQVIQQVEQKMNNRVQFPPCLYVGQEIIPEIIVTTLRDNEGNALSYASVPQENVDLSDVSVIRSCFVCTSIASNVCGGCRNVTYCSDECHAFHWRFGEHAKECGGH